MYITSITARESSTPHSQYNKHHLPPALENKQDQFQGKRVKKIMTVGNYFIMAQ